MSAQTDKTGLLLDLTALQEAVILLEPEHFDRAIQISQQAISEGQRWQTYLNGLALCGFWQWLKERAADLPIQPDPVAGLQPHDVGGLGTICNLKVGEFTLSLIVTESVTSERIAVPTAIVDQTTAIAHFYVLIEVQEEQEQAILRGCLRYDQFTQYCQTHSLPAQPDQTYQFPLDWFDSDSSHLLFYLRFLDPLALALPAAPTVQPLEQLRNQTEQRVNHVAAQIKQPVINVWNWSRDRWDETAQAIAWSLPQPLTPAVAMRRSPEKVEAALQDLIQHQGIEVPQQARYAYTKLEGTVFQLCAVTWLLSTDAMLPVPPDSAQTWALLLILVAQPGRVLPVGTKLQITTPTVPTEVLTEAVLQTTDLYLYVWVEGNPNDAFNVTIVSPHNLPASLPAFVCHPDRL